MYRQVWRVTWWALLVGLLLTGCSSTPDEGPAGATEPAGSAGPRGPDGRTAGAPAPGEPRDGEATVFWVLLEPQRDDARFATEEGSLLTPRTVDVGDADDPAVAAVRAVMSEEQPGPGLANAAIAGFTGPGGTSRFDVVSVEHRDGLVTVDFTADFYDPCPTCLIALPSDTGSIVQQYVLTAQAALGTDDPVLFTADGEPVKGIWFERLRGPVEADHSLVVPPVADDPPVAAAELATAPGPRGAPSMTAEVSGVVGLDDGCVVLDGRPAVWPRGFTAWVVEDRLVLLDGAGRIVAREGDRVVAGGGLAPPPAGEPCLPAGGADVAHLQTDVRLAPR